MFKHYFEQVHNVAIWPIISLTIFFVFFIGLTIYVWRIKKSYVNQMGALPLSDDDAEPTPFSANLNNH